MKKTAMSSFSNHQEGIIELLKKFGLEADDAHSTLVLATKALTHISCKQADNYERLEFLGDAVLRLAATEFIDRN